MAKYSIVELITICYTCFTEQGGYYGRPYQKIELTDELELNECILAVLRRYNALRIDRELVFLSLPTDPETREAELEKSIDFLRSCFNEQDSEQN